MQPTPYHDLNRVLRELADSVQTILCDTFIGAYLQGSFAVGDFDLHSDVDWLIAVEAEPSAAQVAALQAMHERVYHLNSRWARHLEGSYFPRDVLRSASGRGANLWYLDNGARSLIQSDHCNTLVVRTVVREQGIILHGPDPRILIDAISADALRQEIYETMTTWGQEILDDPRRYSNRFYQAYLVLNYCRMLHDLVNGRTGSKLAGAEWALQNLDDSWAGLIERSWTMRTNAANWSGLPADATGFQQTLAFVQYIMTESKRYVVG